jgi:hypothetical protein
MKSTTAHRGRCGNGEAVNFDSGPSRHGENHHCRTSGASGGVLEATGMGGVNNGCEGRKQRHCEVLRYLRRGFIF